MENLVEDPILMILCEAAILGPGAPQAIISSDNLTSNCWPLTPKEHDLAFVEDYEQTVSFHYDLWQLLEFVRDTNVGLD